MKKNVLESLKEQIRDEPFANHMGIRLRDIGSGYAVMEARFSEGIFRTTLVPLFAYPSANSLCGSFTLGCQKN